jgi:hypothetical protein
MSLADLGALRRALHLQPPAWLKGARMTGIGRRVSGGRQQDEWAIHVMVDRKRPRENLRSGEVIPGALDGLPIDVLAPAPLVVLPGREAGAGAAPDHLASGAPVADRFGGNGTIGCIGVTLEGRPVLVTTWHVVGQAAQAVSGGHVIGTGGARVGELAGQMLYGADAMHPDELFQVEATTVDLHGGQKLRGGLPGGLAFSVASTGDSHVWLSNARVRSYGAATVGWRTGSVLTLFPLRPDVHPDGSMLTGLCLVQEDGQGSLDGDSGSLWVAEHAGGFVAVGLHWGQVWETNQVKHAFVTELEAALSWLRIHELKGGPDWTATT